MPAPTPYRSDRQVDSNKDANDNSLFTGALTIAALGTAAFLGVKALKGKADNIAKQVDNTTKPVVETVEEIKKAENVTKNHAETLSKAETPVPNDKTIEASNVDSKEFDKYKDITPTKSYSNTIVDTYNSILDNKTINNSILNKNNLRIEVSNTEKEISFITGNKGSRLVVPKDIKGYIDNIPRKDNVMLKTISSAYGKDVNELTDNEILKFVTAHELGHADDFYRNFNGDFQQFKDYSIKNANEYNKKLGDAVGYSGDYSNSDNINKYVLQKHYGLPKEEFIGKMKEYMNLVHENYRARPHEAYADNYAINMIKEL